MRKIVRVAPVLLLVVGQMFNGSPAQAHGCSGIAPAQTSCVVVHGPYGQWSSEPEPSISWGAGFTGVIEAKVVGQFGATSIQVCNVLAGSGNCSIPRDDHMQCCTERWTLTCTANGVGTWSCGH